MDTITVDEIAARLQLRKSIHSHTVLFLGARAGGLFRNPFFYHWIERFISNSTSFKALQEPEKFEKCYSVLSSFSKTAIHNVLLASFKESVARPENDALAQIVQEDVFDVIISTNIDPFVEEAFGRAGLRDPFEFRVFIPGDYSPNEIRRPETQYTLLKVFGDWKSGHYNTAGNEFVLDDNRELKEFLESTLSENLLIIGYDPVWDAPIERAFPLLGGDCWYVNEEPPVENSHLARMIRRRQGKSLIGAQGSFGPFITTLDSKLMLSPSKTQDILEVTAPLLQTLQSAKEIPSITGEEKKRIVFISYSHKDVRDFETLRTHITSVKRAGLIEVWDDTKIKPGTDWRQEIKIALNQARVAILLVSKDFLASKFIAENELPPLLAAAKTGGTVVVPVILSPCLYDESPLSRFQAVNHPSKPLSSMKPYERDEIWVELIRFVIEEVQSIK